MSAHVRDGERSGVQNGFKFKGFVGNRLGM